MVKKHNCHVRIYNGQNSSDMTYMKDWYDSGRLPDGDSWPKTIQPDHEGNVQNYERDWSLAGCSGYVTYNMFDADITIAFSNPASGRNKLGIGKDGWNVWNSMSNHDYSNFTININTNDGKAILHFDCKCTGGSTNNCTVKITAYRK